MLDSLSPEQVMQSETEECVELVKLLPPTEAALLDWVINLMADVAEFEHLNKMNARNVAMVFASKYDSNGRSFDCLDVCVQVMNFLRTLFTRTLRETKDCILEAGSLSRRLASSDDNDHQSSSRVFQKTTSEDKENRDGKAFVEEEPNLESSSGADHNNLSAGNGSQN